MDKPTNLGIYHDLQSQIKPLHYHWSSGSSGWDPIFVLSTPHVSLESFKVIYPSTHTKPIEKGTRKHRTVLSSTTIFALLLRFCCPIFGFASGSPNRTYPLFGFPKKRWLPRKKSEIISKSLGDRVHPATPVAICESPRRTREDFPASESPSSTTWHSMGEGGWLITKERGIHHKAKKKTVLPCTPIHHVL